ncbi:hypothetical protein ACWEU6_37105 [Streptosporangium sandarakinum]|uniref:hypothetical protein n=1 Tax=Streptosporangium sandarakinum TaxID=1260955 RepID=UPI0036826BCC
MPAAEGLKVVEAVSAVPVDVVDVGPRFGAAGVVAECGGAAVAVAFEDGGADAVPVAGEA